MALIGTMGGPDPLGLSHPCDQQNLFTLARDVRLTLGAGCPKDSKTATSAHDFLENLKTPVASDTCVFKTELRLQLIEADAACIFGEQQPLLLYTTPDDHKQDDPSYLSDSSLDKNEAVDVIKTGATWVALLNSVRAWGSQKDLSETDIAQRNNTKDKTGIPHPFDVINQ